MPRPEPHEPEKLTRYVCGDLSPGEQGKLEEHLRGCVPCRDYVSFVREFNTSVREARPPKPIADEPCPDSALLVDLEAGELDEDTAQHVRAHLLFCGNCREAFYALRRLHPVSWTRIVIRALQGALELLSVSGTGEILQPAYAEVTRGKEERPTPIRVKDMVSDPETGETSTVRLMVEADPNSPRATVRLEVDPPRSAWEVRLLDAANEELASVPAGSSRVTLSTELPFGSYTVEIYKGQHAIAGFGLEIQALEVR